MADQLDIANDLTGVRDMVYERYAHSHAANLDRSARYYQRLLRRHLSLRRSMRCADLACGSGNFLAYFQLCELNDWIGVDNNSYQVKAAQEQFGADRVLLMDVREFLANAQPAAYDFLSALDFVEHLTKEECLQFIELVIRTLRTGGSLLVRTPNAAAPFGMAARYNDLTHQIGFTPGGLCDVLRTLGFSSVSVWEDGPRPGSLVQTLHWSVWRLARLGWRAMDAAETGNLSGCHIFTRNFWALARK